MKNFRFEMTKVYTEIPPPPVGLESGRSYVETKSVSPVDTISLINVASVSPEFGQRCSISSTRKDRRSCIATVGSADMIQHILVWTFDLEYLLLFV